MEKPTLLREIFIPAPPFGQQAEAVSDIGTKASGLLLVPPSWQPPLFILKTSCYLRWKESLQHSAELLQQAADNIFDQCQRFDGSWTAGIILRSSATAETMQDRGAFKSVALTADYSSNDIATTLEAIFSNFASLEREGAIAIIVQPKIPGPNLFLGHISNERHVSKTINHWRYEVGSENSGGRFNSQRTSEPNDQEPLHAVDDKHFLNTLRAVGRWATHLNKGPVHIEWAWSNNRVWILQIDFEDDTPDEGIDPTILIRDADVTPVIPSDASPFSLVIPNNNTTGWGKIDKISALADVRSEPYPPLYYISGSVLKSYADKTAELSASIKSFSNGRVVCRTDCKNTSIEKLNLPRTNSVSPEEAVAFMRTSLEKLITKGAHEDEVCFILHRFIPAKASAWAVADPALSIVRVDSLWGIPDGLQFLPHDTFEYDTKRRSISTTTTRFKVGFIQETENGVWTELKVSRRLARSVSLSAPDVREVAQQTYSIAKKVGHKIQVMWFCDIPEALGIGRNLPWFRMTAHEFEPSAPHAAGPSRTRFEIRTKMDLVEAKKLTPGSHVLVLNPDIEIIRADGIFLDELIAAAQQLKAPVELSGSILGHAYYMLRRAGLTVIASGEPSYSRVRGKRQFAKLVRDRVPDQINKQGETTVLAQIPRQEARAALIIKLFEEAHELLIARSPEEVEGELADIFEVVRGLAAATGVSWVDVEQTAKEKRDKRGGFENGTVLMETAWSPTQKRRRAPQKVSLSALARKSEIGQSIQINFAALIAAGANRAVTLPDGSIYEINLTATGLQLTRVNSANDAAEQLTLPGMIKDH